MSDAMMERNSLDIERLNSLILTILIERFYDPRDLHGTFTGYILGQEIRDLMVYFPGDRECRDNVFRHPASSQVLKHTCNCI
jgi:hypothetical protein